MPGDRYRHAIICLTETGDFASRLVHPEAVSVSALHKRSGHDLKVYWRLRKLLKELQPSIVHTRNLAALEMQFVTLSALRTKRVHS